MISVSSSNPDVPIAAFGELRLIQSRHDFDRPPRDEFCSLIHILPSLESFSWK